MGQQQNNEDILAFLLNAEPYQAICITVIIIVLILAIFTNFFNDMFTKNDD